MSKIKLPHASGNSVSIAAPQSNPAADRTLYLPGGGDATLCTTVDRGFQAGEIVQVQAIEFQPTTGSPSTFTDGTYTSMGAVGLEWAFTPKFSDSIIIQELSFESKLNDENGHARWEIYDDTNSAVFHNGDYCAASHYYDSTEAWIQVSVRAKGNALNTNARTYKLRVRVADGGTIYFNWSNYDRRLITVMEIKQ